MSTQDIKGKELVESGCLNDEFLATLLEAAKVCGWDVSDYGVVQDFVEWCYAFAEKSIPNTEPYPYED